MLRERHAPSGKSTHYDTLLLLYLLEDRITESDLVATVRSEASTAVRQAGPTGKAYSPFDL